MSLLPACISAHESADSITSSSQGRGSRHGRRSDEIDGAMCLHAHHASQKVKEGHSTVVPASCPRDQFARLFVQLQEPRLERCNCSSLIDVCFNGYTKPSRKERKTTWHSRNVSIGHRQFGQPNSRSAHHIAPEEHATPLRSGVQQRSYRSNHFSGPSPPACTSRVCLKAIENAPCRLPITFSPQRVQSSSNILTRTGPRPSTALNKTWLHANQ